MQLSKKDSNPDERKTKASEGTAKKKQINCEAYLLNPKTTKIFNEKNQLFFEAGSESLSDESEAIQKRNTPMLKAILLKALQTEALFGVGLNASSLRFGGIMS